MSRVNVYIDDLCLKKHKKSVKLRQYIAATSVSLGAVCCGSVLAWSSPALDQLTSNKTTITLTSQETALIGGILPIGALLSAIPGGYLADKFGRKFVILLTSLLFLLNWLFIIFAKNALTLIIGRFFAGMAMGAICVAAPVYVGEIAEVSLRGVLGSFFQLFLASGVLLTNIIGSLTSWNLLSIILSLVPVLFGGSFLLMPESPIYLIKNGKLKNGRKSLMNFRNENEVDEEISIARKEMDQNNTKENIGFLQIFFKEQSVRKALIAGIGVLLFQQLSGINAVVFYTVSIFNEAGSSLDPSICAIIMSTVQVVVSYISIIIIEKLNRKFYLMFSSIGMMISLTALGMYFHLKFLNITINGIEYLPIISLVVYMIGFSIGYGPVPWMLLGELFAPKIKGVATGLAILLNWLCAFFVTFFFPILKEFCGVHIPFYIFAIFMAIGTLFVYFLVPETKGKSLTEIQNNLNK